MPLWNNIYFIFILIFWVIKVTWKRRIYKSLDFYYRVVLRKKSNFPHAVFCNSFIHLIYRNMKHKCLNIIF